MRSSAKSITFAVLRAVDRLWSRLVFTGVSIISLNIDLIVQTPRYRVGCDGSHAPLKQSRTKFIPKDALEMQGNAMYTSAFAVGPARRGAL